MKDKNKKLTGELMRKLIDAGVCPNCDGELSEHTIVKEVLASGNCDPCMIHWDAWQTPGNQQAEATLWQRSYQT